MIHCQGIYSLCLSSSLYALLQFIFLSEVSLITGLQLLLVLREALLGELDMLQVFPVIFRRDDDIGS